MNNAVLTEDFASKLQDMYRWYRSQLPVERLSQGDVRGRKTMGMVPFVLTEALDGSAMTVQGRRLARRGGDEPAQLVAVGQTAQDGTFKLDTSADIDHDADVPTFQTEMDTLFGPDNSIASIGGGVWLVRFRGNLRGSNPTLMVADSSKLIGTQKASVVKTLFNAEVQTIQLFDFMPHGKGQDLPIGTIGYAYHFPGIGYGIVSHNQHRPTVLMYGKADANIAAAATGTVSIYRGTQDTGANVSAKNLTDQQADSGVDVEVTEYVDENSDLVYGLKPLECPA